MSNETLTPVQSTGPINPEGGMSTEAVQRVLDSINPNSMPSEISGPQAASYVDKHLSDPTKPFEEKMGKFADGTEPPELRKGARPSENRDAYGDEWVDIGDIREILEFKTDTGEDPFALLVDSQGNLHGRFSENLSINEQKLQQVYDAAVGAREEQRRKEAQELEDRRKAQVERINRQLDRIVAVVSSKVGSNDPVLRQIAFDVLRSVTASGETDEQKIIESVNIQTESLYRLAISANKESEEDSQVRV